MLAAEAEPTPIAVGQVNGRYFLNTLVAGLGTEETTPYVAPKRLGANTVGGVAPRNISSHSLEVFKSLLTGRVWVAQRPDYQGKHVIQNRVQAVYHSPDGTAPSSLSGFGRMR